MLKNNEKNEFLEIIEFLNDAIMVIEKKNKKIKFVNYRFEELFNTSKKNLKNKDIDFFFKGTSTILDYIGKSISKQESYSFGDIKFSFDAQNFNVCLDIINKIEYENIIMVIKSNKKKNFYNIPFENKFEFFDDFISKLISYIINPISNIKGSAQLLQKVESKNTDFYEIIIKEANKLVNFIKIFEPKQPNLKKIKNNFNIHEIIRSAVKNIDSVAINKIQLIENFDPSLPNVSINKKELIILFEELIANALESISIEDGYIKISTSFYFGEVQIIPNIKKNISSNYILIQIEDNGSGIKEEFENQVFLPFFSTKNRKGLGLYQANKIAIENDCAIQFHSERNMTTFKIWIPL